MPEICCLILLLHSRQLFLRTNFANLTRSLVAILEEVCSSNLFFNAKIPSLCGMLEYRPTASAVTRKEPSGTLECLTKHLALKTLNENQETLILTLLEFHRWRLRVFQVYYQTS